MRLTRTILAAALAALVVQAAVPTLATAHGSKPDIDGLHQRATVKRDHSGIAHIQARNRHDLYFLQGWVHAQDRLFQMDVNRRTADGTLAELLGPPALSQDVELRTIGLHRSSELTWQGASPRARLAFESYAEGVNAWVARHDLPIEYGALQFGDFRPWTPQDSIKVGKLIAFGLSFDLDIDLTLAYLAYVQTGAAAGFDGNALFLDDLNQSIPFTSATTVPDATDGSTASSHEKRGGRSLVTATGELADLRGLLEDYRDKVAKVPALANALDRADTFEGSNEWAISGRHTRDGRPILANDPHLSIDQPSTFYPIHLEGAGLNVQGEGFAGAPGVILGQNEHIAWGATTNPMDVTDTYRETVVPDPASPSGLSTVYQGQNEPIIPIPETFRVNQGGTVVVVPPAAGVPPATLIVPRRNNGPIIQLDAAAGTALSVQYTGFSATQELDTFLQWNEAKDLDDFTRGLENFDFGSQNWAYVDRRGNIAYFTSGEMPLREDLEAGFVNGSPPWMIRSGEGGNEWLARSTTYPGQVLTYEILPPAEMPQTVNPANGWFVNANNDPAGTVLDGDPINQLRPTGGIYYLNAGYDGLRGGRITEMVRDAVEDRKRISVRDVEQMQADTVFVDAEFFVPEIRAAFEAAQASNDPSLAALAADAGIAEAVGRLASWDFSSPTGIREGYDSTDSNGHLRKPSKREVGNSAAATIYSMWRSRVMDDTVGRTLGQFSLPRPRTESELVALRRILSGDPQSSGLDFFAVPGVSDPAVAQDIVLLRSVRAALDRLASPDFSAAFGESTDQSDYRWGLLHRVSLDHPLGGDFSVPTGFGEWPAPLAGLRGIPVDGGFGTVDAASHNARANSVDGFMFGGGPARRYIGVGEHWGIDGQSALPGGTSSDPDSTFYLNLLTRYLTNDYYNVRL